MQNWPWIVIKFLSSFSSISQLTNSTKYKICSLRHKILQLLKWKCRILSEESKAHSNTHTHIGTHASLIHCVLLNRWMDQSWAHFPGEEEEEGRKKGQLLKAASASFFFLYMYFFHLIWVAYTLAFFHAHISLHTFSHSWWSYLQQMPTFNQGRLMRVAICINSFTFLVSNKLKVIATKQKQFGWEKVFKHGERHFVYLIVEQ